jgi:hypothetical protein
MYAAQTDKDQAHSGDADDNGRHSAVYLIARACSESAERSKTVVTPNHISVLDGDDLNPSWRSTRPRNVNLNEQASPRTGSS